MMSLIFNENNVSGRGTYYLYCVLLYKKKTIKNIFLITICIKQIICLPVLHIN